MIKKVKHYLMYRFDPRYMHEPEYFYSHLDMTSCGEEYAIVKEVEFDIVVPEGFDPRAQTIANLEAQKKKAKADYERLMNTLDGKIQSLRCIEHKPE